MKKIKKIPPDDYRFIQNYVNVIHSRVAQTEPPLADAEKTGFYYGKEITWQAVEEGLYIERNEYAYAGEVTFQGDS